MIIGMVIHNDLCESYQGVKNVLKIEEKQKKNCLCLGKEIQIDIETMTVEDCIVYGLEWMQGVTTN